MRGVARASSTSCALLVASLATTAAMPSLQVSPIPAQTTLVALTVVVSRGGQPVSDLQVTEIEVLDNGVPQRIVAFEYVDTVTGDSPEPQGDFVLVLDDLGTPQAGTGDGIMVGLGLVDALGPDDRLAVVNTGPFPLIQPLSTDREGARATIRQFLGQGDTSSLASAKAEACRRSVVSLGVIENALRVMTQQPSTRRAMLVVSDGQRVYWGEARHEKCSQARKAFDRVIAAASVANVPIYGVDVRGQRGAPVPRDLTTRSHTAIDGASSVTVTAGRRSETVRGSLGVLAGATAGTFTAGQGGLVEGVHQLVRDSRQYYRLAYSQPDARRVARNKFRPIEVRVRRPGAEVRARQR